MASPRIVVVSVNATKESDTAFRLALHELKSGDKLLIVFSRPLRLGSKTRALAILVGVKPV